MEGTRKEGIILIIVLLTPNVVVFDNAQCPAGVKLDQKKEDTSIQILTPRHKQYLSLLLGIVNNLLYFMPNSSYLTSDLGGLLKKDALFQWS